MYWPEFEDAEQVYDSWVHLAHIAAHTEDIALSTGSIVLPLRHPLHIAKAAAPVDRLSNGRLVLSIASGDRPPEFPAFSIDDDPEIRFRGSISVLRTVWSGDYPELGTSFGTLDGSLDLVPKPTTGTLPLLVTGYAGQSLDWIADYDDGWVYYQQELDNLESIVADWRRATDHRKPFVLVIDINLKADPTAETKAIHQGYTAGSDSIEEQKYFWYIVAE